MNTSLDIPLFQFTVCICTRNRPEDLVRALRSIQHSVFQVHEVIVSDDSTDDRTEQVIHADFPEVKYIRGPKMGLSANRNHAIRAVTGTHLLFIDDDVILSFDFFLQIVNMYRRHEANYGNQIIITGLENKNGVIIFPHDQTFLGFQNRPYGTGEPLHTLVINSSVFPLAVFQHMKFDEQLVYGYEEVDLATRAVRGGYPILLTKDAINMHYPSEINRDYYKPHLVTSRLYVTFKRYFFTERKRLKALSFFVIATGHTLLHAIKTEGKQGVIRACKAISNSLKYMRVYLKERRA
ncbi:MAG: glycosyltransferase family 2 protein [Candidatus Cohnella colombiensis]|uniref:Glycosyltransferase family 2 protein n=1 Tax=Candidatus Cohnella colombiensis TaxID=3121368 RepID=A0AA95EY39_9BACL|nr:MAG: glycosyltransferase family 2 protein [Cohnella sp.]